ncbi:MAG TPA: hypothetical protein PKG60_03235 [Spirochaetota bacterium]|nr:hypothetical protein [Spirochaetota bacterium]HPS86558.1 hypothetical protein [Spirochaetota bacterium]
MKKLINILLMMILLLSCAGKDEKDDPRLRLKYVNLKYMFTLQFSERWISYMDFEKNEIIDPQIIIPVVYFALPTRSREWQSLIIPAGYADLFYVRIFTKAQWKLYEERYKGSDEFRLSDKFPGQGKDFVYMIRYSSSIPVDLYIYMKESNPITETFKIIKQD